MRVYRVLSDPAALHAKPEAARRRSDLLAEPLHCCSLRAARSGTRSCKPASCQIWLRLPFHLRLKCRRRPPQNNRRRAAQPAPTAAPTQQQAAPRPAPSPCLRHRKNRPRRYRRPPLPAAPAAQPATQAAASIREPEMVSLSGRQLCDGQQRRRSRKSRSVR